MFKKILGSIFLLMILVISSMFYLFYNKNNIVWIGYSEDMFFKVEEVVSGLGVPWGMDFLDEGNIIFTERSGKIGIINLDRGQYEIIYKLSDLFENVECGLLDVKVSPKFSKNDLIYFSYAKNIDGYGYTSLATAKLVDHKIQDWKDIFVSKHKPTDSGFHCGSRITFDDEGHLFMSLGDRGARVNAQDLSTHAGAIIRLNLDGSTPADNPFVTDKNVLPEIWSIGHRNPQGLYYDSLSRKLWSNEHGPRGGDEVNLIRPGLNYGWPVITYGREYTGPTIGEGVEKAGIEGPLKIWSPSIAPSSLLYYAGGSLPGWIGNLFSTSLAQKHLNRLVIDSTGRIIFEERLLGEIKERFRALIQDKIGDLYLSTDSGRILKISYTDSESYYRANLFRHFDMPGLYVSFNFNFMYAYTDAP